MLQPRGGVDEWTNGRVEAPDRSVGPAALPLFHSSIRPLMNTAASQTSSAGWVGGWPRPPKFSTEGTRPAPKWRIQIWLTATGAVRGFSRSVSQRARARRRPVLVAG